MHNEPTMKSIEWKCTPLIQLNTLQLFDLIKLRIDIFVVEQTCAYPELDEKDRHPDTLHMMGFIHDELICCARLLAPSVSYTESSIGRFAVKKSHRHQGIGSKLMLQCLSQSHDVWPGHDIRISAQQYLQPFYSCFGYKQTSDMYLEDGIPHIEMLRKSSALPTS